jgi:hypothetical protein
MSHAARVTLLLAVLVSLLPPTTRAQTPATTVKDSEGAIVFQSNVDGGLRAPGAFGTGTIPAEGTGTRLMWWPNKAAFRVGRVGVDKDGTQWDASKVGEYSVAFGVDTKASGFGATAMGDKTTASGLGATAMGARTTAGGTYALATGLETTASSGSATAIGAMTTASGTVATAMGSETTASGNRATAMGNQTTATGLSATTMGFRTTAEGLRSTAMGDGTTASGEEATAMGEGTTASGNWSTAMGLGTSAATPQSLSIAKCNSANASADGTLFAVGNGAYDRVVGICTSPGDAFTVDTDGNATASAHETFSDRRLKTAITPLGDSVLAKLTDLRAVRYRFKNQTTHPSGEQLGLVAQDVRNEFPALVSEGSGGMLSLAYPKLTAVLVKGLQEQQAKIEKKDEKIAELRDTQRQIQRRLASLEAERRPATAGWLGIVPLRGLDLLLIGGVLGAGLLHLHRR